MSTVNEVPPTAEDAPDDTTAPQVWRPPDSRSLVPTGAGRRLEANLAALRTARQIGDGEATDQDRWVLARWSGWGTLPQVFDEHRHLEFADTRAELINLLGENGYRAARASTMNAHYTDPKLVREIWRGLGKFGFTGGDVLEPGCGSGTFIGLAPSGVRMTGVELDPATARIAQLLYPDATIRAESFADTDLPGGMFDAAIGNVPFGDYALYDPASNPHGFAIHNHFIIKSLGLVHPGGLVAVLTSRYTLDAQDSSARKVMQSMADLVGAVRLPSGAHREVAGTEAVTDLLVFRRRQPLNEPAPFNWRDSTPMEVASAAGDHVEMMPVNKVFQEHGGAVLGRFQCAVGMGGHFDMQVIPYDLGSLPDQLTDQLSLWSSDAAKANRLYTKRHGPPPPVERHPLLVNTVDTMPAYLRPVEGQVRADGAAFGIFDGTKWSPLRVPNTQRQELRDLIALKDMAGSLIRAEASTSGEDASLESLRGKLAKSWQRYLGSYGPLNRFTESQRLVVDEDAGLDEAGEKIKVAQVSHRRPQAIRFLDDDPLAPLLCSLEVFDETTRQASPADILQHRVITAPAPVTHTDSLPDALMVCIDQIGHVDFDRIADLAGTSPEKARDALVSGGLVFEEPSLRVVKTEDGFQSTTFDGSAWQTRSAYLSGDVRDKLDTARLLCLDDPQRWQGNVVALELVKPIDLEPGEITAHLGSTWIPASDKEDFINDILHWDATVTMTAGGESVAPHWSVTGIPSWARDSPVVTSQWGTRRVNAFQLVEHLLNNADIIVRDPDPDDARRLGPVNQTETDAAVAKADSLQERFGQWVWEDGERAGRLQEAYNKKFRGWVPRDYTDEGRTLSLPGLALDFHPDAHQLAAVARLIAEPSVLLAHPVGAGKTAEMVIGAMEMKRLGMVAKPCVVVPNNLLAQWSHEWMRLYPQAKVLVAGSSDLAGDGRRRFVAKAAANDWDGIVMTQGAFKSLKLSDEHMSVFYLEQLRIVDQAIDNLSGREDSRSVKALEKLRARQQAGLQEMQDKAGKFDDKGLSFEETGIDYLLVDEFHEFKNLRTISNSQAAGITGSVRAQDLLAKVWVLRQAHPAKVLCGATGTPIANSITEMHVLQRYFDPERLGRLGMESFDAWAATFATKTNLPEYTATGDVKVVQRLARFNNVPELQALFRAFADVRRKQDLHLDEPGLVGGQHQVITVPASPQLEQAMAGLVKRVEAIQARSPGLTSSGAQDNILVVFSDGRKAALDPRLVGQGAPDVSKAAVAASELLKTWRANQNRQYVDSATGLPSTVTGSLQIVFCDLSTPRTGDWNIYDEIRHLLVEGGMPVDHIRFMQNAKTDADKDSLFAACRSGGVSVLIGSTMTLGLGANIQDRAIRAIDLDAPWRPADVEQRHGRLLRRGNQNLEVQMTSIVTMNSFDAVMWQTLERKGAFIEQVLADSVGRDIEDVGDMTSLYRHTKELAMNDPLAVELAETSLLVEQLDRLAKHHTASQHTLELVRQSLTSGLPELKAEAEFTEELIARITTTAGESFTLSHRGINYPSRKDAIVGLNAIVQPSVYSTYRNWQAFDPVNPIKLGGIDICCTHSHGFGGVEWTEWTINRPVSLDSRTRGQAIKPMLTSRTSGDLIDQGTIRTLEHMVAVRLPNHLTDLRLGISNAEQRLADTEKLIGRPFPKQAELDQARIRYQQLTDRHEQQRAQQQTLADTDDNQDTPALTSPLRTPRVQQSAPDPDTNGWPTGDDTDFGDDPEWGYPSNPDLSCHSPRMTP